MAESRLLMMSLFVRYKIESKRQYEQYLGSIRSPGIESYKGIDNLPRKRSSSANLDIKHWGTKV